LKIVYTIDWRLDTGYEDDVRLPPPEMSPEEEIRVWREWFFEACPGWDEVKDIEVELGRDSLELEA
jgi:hypothetical protein